MKTSLFLILTLFMTLANAQTCKDYITDEWQDSRYTNNGDGTITDKVTKLIWKRCSEGQSGTNCESGTATTHNWRQALDLAANTSFATHTDWRLPNIKELASLAKLNCYNPSINETPFPNTSTGDFWSSSPGADGSDDAWLLDFYNGNDSDGYRGNSYRVGFGRCGQLFFLFSLF
jgi:hypothetical protein